MGGCEEELRAEAVVGCYGGHCARGGGRGGVGKGMSGVWSGESEVVGGASCWGWKGREAEEGRYIVYCSHCVVRQKVIRDRTGGTSFIL